MTEITPVRESSRYRSLLFIFLGSPIIWGLHFMAVYGLGEVACKAGLLRFRVLWLSGPSVIVIVLTLIAFAAALYVGFLAYRRWQQVEDDDERWRGEAEGEFMALVGLLFSGLFAATILVSGIPALFLRPCIWM